MSWLRKKQGSAWRDGFAPRQFGFEWLEAKRVMAGDCVSGFLVAEPHDHEDLHGHHHDHLHDCHDHGAEAHIHSDELREDSFGAYYIDYSSAISSEPVTSALKESDFAHLVPIRVDEVPTYHSNPSARQKIYLDFNGQQVSRTGWNDHNDGKTISAAPFDRDGDSSTFSGAEQRAMELIWSRVAEDFAPFDIDVTTESPSPRDFTVGKKAIRVLVSSNIDQATGDRWFENVGGVAYVGSWKFESDTPVWVFANALHGNEKRIAEAVSHELGHAFGLDHDGTHVDEYFSGFGSGQTSWAPIMGLGSSRAVTQWSQGEYQHASNVENDISIIASEANEIQFRVDDHSTTFFSPTVVDAKASGEFQVDGVISSSSDADIFSFDMDAGRFQLDANGAEFGSNLDIQLTVYDSQVRILGTFNPHDDLSAGFDASFPAGKYFVRVEGVGRGDPRFGGYSEYGSIGAYVLSGSLTNPISQHVVDVGPSRFGFADFLLLAEAYGKDVTAGHPMDLHVDGHVDFRDFLMLTQKYG